MVSTEDDPILARTGDIDELHDVPSHPYPTSPKSIYRLADFLSLPSLVRLALNNYRSQLTVENVAHELFGDVAACYEEIANVALTFAAANWNRIKAQEGMRDVERAVEGGEMPGFAIMSVKLLKLVVQAK